MLLFYTNWAGMDISVSLETMIAAYNEIRNIRVSNPKIHDLRTAAFVSGINKLAASYNTLGFWP